MCVFCTVDALSIQPGNNATSRHTLYSHELTSNQTTAVGKNTVLQIRNRIRRGASHLRPNNPGSGSRSEWILGNGSVSCRSLLTVGSGSGPQHCKIVQWPCARERRAKASLALSAD